MTVLVLARKRIFSFVFIRDLHLRVEDYFARANRGGLLTLFSAVVIILGVAAYVSMLVMTFDSGLGLREAALESERQNEQLERLEALERRREAEFSLRYSAILKEMDKISTLKYLVPEGPTVSQADSGVLR